MERGKFPYPILQNPILVVEDDQKTAALVALYLKREGFLTVHAADGQQALDFAEKHDPMFVVLDLRLAKVDGWEICSRIRQRSDVAILNHSGERRRDGPCPWPSVGSGKTPGLCSERSGAADTAVIQAAPRADDLARAHVIARRIIAISLSGWRSGD